MKSIVYQDKKVVPSKVVCIGRNYVEHIEELGNEIPENMVIFNKPNSSISDSLGYFGEGCRFEGEICLLVHSGEIVGLGLGLDMTLVDIQNSMKKKGLPWERAKSFDGAAVLSDFVPFDGELRDIRFELFINQELTQQADYTLMMYKPSEMLDEISSFMTLDDYDVIMTVTPKGVGYYKIGDEFEMKLYDGDSLILESSWIAR